MSDDPKTRSHTEQRMRTTEALQAIRKSGTFQRLTDIAKACQTSGALVSLWAQEIGMTVWSNPRAGRLVGTLSARMADDRFMKAIYETERKKQ